MNAGDTQSILQRFPKDPMRLTDMLIAVQDAGGYLSEQALKETASYVGVSTAEVRQTSSFYHFLTEHPAGEYAVYVNDSAVARMMGYDAVVKAFEEEAGVAMGGVTEDGRIGLHTTADIGMNDQEPAAIINGTMFTRLTPERVKKLVAGMKAGTGVAEMVGERGDGNNAGDLIASEVCNNIRQKGPVIFDDFETGSAVRACLESKPEEVTEVVKNANLRGRGGAGFPAGMKWEFCRKAEAEKRFVVCNADEGEPGTFKDRVLLTERAPMLVEGMTVAAYCAGASEGIIYLRHEYRYLQRHLEDVLARYREQNLLGDKILGKDFSFDIRIQLGAGAYVCGEESALIESAEGKRGEPRNRPPYPVQVGYRGLPTAVNNVETLCAAARIVIKGADWFRALGTAQSVGTKVLSVSGDCANPGIYEVEWGVSLSDMLKLVGGEGAQAVQVGGASGTCVAPAEFGRTLGDNDLATGGSFIVIGPDRDLLSVVSNFVDFFVDESCGVCVPCRVGNLVLRRKLDKILSGHGVESDLTDILELGKVMKSTSRCGLGQTAANPLVTTIRNLRPLYEKRMASGADYDTEFDLAEAVKESCEYAGRTPNL